MAMVFKRTEHLAFIADRLSWISISCELRGHLKLFDDHIVAQHFFRRLLNCVFDLQLIELDKTKTNYPAIDLGDLRNQIAFQITSDKSRRKVQVTIDKFFEHELDQLYHTLRILVIGTRQTTYSRLSIPTGSDFDFNTDRDIVGVKELLDDINKLETDRLEELVAILKEELAAPSGDICSIEQAFSNASAALLAWPTDLGRGERIDRPEFAVIVEKVSRCQYSTTLLLGPPGSGKSALLARLADKFRQSGTVVLAIKADALSSNASDSESLASAFGLSESIEHSVLRSSVVAPVVVIIDQLDALGDIADLHSGRLNSILNLIREIHGRTNVHVVCSCRDYEHRRDARLRAINADDVVVLQLPTWESVSEVLKSRSIPTDGWPESFRELLRVPQQLKVFLQLSSESGTNHSYESYQGMLDDLWNRRILNDSGSSGRSALVSELATALTEEEELWLPIVRFEDRIDLIDKLIGAEVLVRNPPGTAVGFAHQSLLDHARARAFIRHESSMAQFAIERQDGLFVRSKLWAGLTYLHGADPSMFRREFSLLWENRQLRAHLRHLLIDFLGTVSNPWQDEQRWLIDAMQKGLGDRVLMAIRGNAAWFEFLLRSQHLRRLMLAVSNNSWALQGLLGAALNSARKQCLQLLRETWLQKPDLDRLTLNVLAKLRTWDNDAAEITEVILARTEIYRAWILHVYDQSTEMPPAIAIRLIAVHFRRELTECIERSQKAPASDTREIEHYVVSRNCFHRLIEGVDGWYGIEKLAEASPAEFLMQMWPLFIAALEHCVYPERDNSNRLRIVHGIEYDFEDAEGRRMNPFPHAIASAIRQLSREFPNEFAAFLSKEGNRDWELVQQLLSLGLLEIASIDPVAGLYFLTDDPRRFRIGDWRDQSRDTIRLMAAIAPHLTDEQFVHLEDAILRWSTLSQGDEEFGAEYRRTKRQSDRRHRLRLLSVLPIQRLSQKTRELVGREREVFPDYERPAKPDYPKGMVFIGSPMSAKQMQLAANPDIVNLFAELVDQTESSHPRDWMRGGSSQASGEFEKFAEALPERAISVIAQLKPELHERPAGSGLIGVSKSDASDDVVFQLLFELDRRGFRSVSFRVDAARALEPRIRDGVGLPDAVVELLERWLDEPWPAGESPSVLGDSRVDEQRSILWGIGRPFSLPDGMYRVLIVLSYAYMCRRPKAAERWLLMLERHLDCLDYPIATLNAMSRVFARLLHHCDPAAATRFLQTLFSRFPEVLANREGAILLANVWQICPDETAHAWMQQILKSDWSLAAQACGELVVLRSLHYPNDRFANDALETIVDDPTCSTASKVGAAYACAHLWCDPATRRRATDVLVRLISCPDPSIGNAAMYAFVTNDPLIPDDDTHRLLEVLLAHHRAIDCDHGDWIIEKLEAHLPHDLDLVYGLSREIIALYGQHLNPLRPRWSIHSDKLTAIALSLHRMDGFRAQGLELYEKLLDAQIPDAVTALREIDQRPPDNC